MIASPALSPDVPTKIKRPYYRPTTAAQRRYLFHVYERTGIIREACRAVLPLKDGLCYILLLAPAL